MNQQFDNGPRLRVKDNPAIESADRITIEAWVNTLSWPTRAVVCRKDGSYILYNYSGGFCWYLFGPDSRLQYDIAGALGNGSWGYIVGTYEKDAGTNNQRLYLNDTRVAQMTETLPIDLNSAALGIGSPFVEPPTNTRLSGRFAAPVSPTVQQGSSSKAVRRAASSSNSTRSASV